MPWNLYQIKVRLPAAEASSVYHTWVTCCMSLSWLMRGMVASAYKGMASGSPWVSSDHSTWPSTKSSVGFSIGVDDDHSERWAEMLHVAECQFPVQRVKSILASTSTTASVSSRENSAIIPRAATSMLAICPAQSCLEPAAPWRSLLVIRRTSFTMIFVWVSPIQ